MSERTMDAPELIAYLKAAGMKTEVLIDGKPISHVEMPYGGPVNIVSEPKRRWWRR